MQDETYPYTIETVMKRITLFAALLISYALSLPAQDIVVAERMYNGSFSLVPKEVTSLKKPYIAAVGYDKTTDDPTINIYSHPGDEEPVISMKVPQQQSGETYYEVAEGVKENVVIRNKFYDIFDYVIGDTSMIADMEALIRNLWGYGETFKLTEFTDADSMQAFVGNNLSNNKYFNYEKYGDKYPLEYWGINEERRLCMYHYFGYETVYDYSEAVWTKDLDYSKKDGYEEFTCYLEPFIYQDLDNSVYPASEIYASQNIFNNDTKWEYLILNAEYYATRSDGREYPDGKIRRTVYNQTYFTSINIIDDEGRELLNIPLTGKEDEFTISINIKTVAIIDGFLYILTKEIVRKGAWENNYYDRQFYDGIYIIDPNKVEVKSISRAPSRMVIRPNVIDQGNRLDIQVSASGQNDNITVSSMSGQVLDQTQVQEDNTASFETGAMPKGIYNVTLRGNGNQIENQRIIIK